jgi:uncharacterized membrane protein
MELIVARVLSVGTYLAVGLLAAGVVLLIMAGRSPLEGGPRLDASRLGPDLAALRPEGLLWLGLLTVIATPSLRVMAALVGFVSRGERGMALVAIAILGIIALGVVLGLGAGA